MDGLHGGLHGHDDFAGGGAAAALVFPPTEFKLNGDVSLVTPSASGTYPGTGTFDGQPILDRDQYLDSVVLWQLLDGDAGTTEVEVYVWPPGGPWAQITTTGALSLAAGGGNDAAVQSAVTGAPLLVVGGSRVAALFTSVQSSGAGGTPTDVVVSFIWTAP